MQNVFTEYPPVPWKQGWTFQTAPGSSCPLRTGDEVGKITSPASTWFLQLLDPSIPLSIRLLSNGLSLCVNKREEKENIQVLFTEDGILTGRVKAMPLPMLIAEEYTEQAPGLTWIKSDAGSALLLSKESRFALVTGTMPKELALLKAEEALEENFNELRSEETRKRAATASLFSINPRHNPPVALAAESLRKRLRSRNAAVHGIWSASDTADVEAFSLNELYPLVHAWNLIEPETSLALVRTALSLQQSTGGFPAWINEQGVTSSAASWPLIIQSFELALQVSPDAALLKKSLPALRKYMQWALRRFDPHRDLIPAWQSEQEVFIPGSFERGKATPDVTVMLIGEIESLLRLCETNDHSVTAIDPLQAEYEQLTRTLTATFWNPQTKAFSNVWKEGHYIHEPSFGSFLPLCWPNLPDNLKSPLLERFEETRGFPGRTESAGWEKEEVDDTTQLPAIHQFMALKALSCADAGRSLLMLFVRRTREGFSAWFEREGIEAARRNNHNQPTADPAYPLGPVTASLLLTAQQEFRHETVQQAPTLKTAQRLFHRLRFNRTDLTIILCTGLVMLFAHLLYRPVARASEEAKVAEAALCYRQGRFTDAMQICRRYPKNALSQFLQGNLMMLAGSPERAESLYYEALLKETESPSALFGYALSLQMNEKFDAAMRRYSDFLDIHEVHLGRSSALVQLAYEFLRLADEEFSQPPKWKRVYTLQIMNDLGL